MWRAAQWLIHISSKLRRVTLVLEVRKMLDLPEVLSQVSAPMAENGET
jgi:hypothetical protein